ncbi:unnamed protein product [Choristocarpus tenellus]
MDTGRLVVSVARHLDVVTSLSLADAGGGYARLVTGSRDTTLMVWRVDPGRNPPIATTSPVHVLYGHDTPVTCVAADASLDVVVSSGEDGTIVMHTLWTGEYVRTIAPSGLSPASQPPLVVQRPSPGSVTMKEGLEAPAKGTTSEGSRVGCGGGGGGGEPPWPALDWVGLSREGYVVSFSAVGGFILRSYTINGHALGSACVGECLRAFAFSEDGAVLLTGGEGRRVTLRWAHSLSLADDGTREGCGEALLTGACVQNGVSAFSSTVRCLALTAGERHLLVGLEDGCLGVLALDASYLRQRLRSRLDQLGF